MSFILQRKLQCGARYQHSSLPPRDSFKPNAANTAQSAWTHRRCSKIAAARRDIASRLIAHAMNHRHDKQPFYSRKGYRILTGAFGLFLIGVGVYAVLLAETSPNIRLVGGAIIVLLGGDMIVSACKATQSWLSKLGPLP